MWLEWDTHDLTLSRPVAILIPNQNPKKKNNNNHTHIFLSHYIKDPLISSSCLVGKEGLFILMSWRKLKRNNSGRETMTLKKTKVCYWLAVNFSFFCLKFLCQPFVVSFVGSCKGKSKFWWS